MKLRILLAILLGLTGLFTSPTSAFAVIQSLEGQTGQIQSFQNDPNIRIDSLNNMHTLKWDGILSVSRGGTGTSLFTNGSIPFIFGRVFSQDNSNFFWDDINNRLGIGTSSPTATLNVVGNTSISGNLDVLGSDIFISVGAENDTAIIRGIDATTTNAIGGELLINSGNGNGSGRGGEITLNSGNGGNDGAGGNMNINAGQGGVNGGVGGDFDTTAGDGTGNNGGGDIHLFAGTGGAGGGNGGIVTIQGGQTSGGNSNGGDIILNPGASSGTGTKGTVKIKDPTSLIQALFNTSFLTTSDKTFTFPNFSGTFGLLEANQIWSGLNKFEASINSTIYVGSSVKSGCIALGDSDGNGITYITANDGVLTASTTKPSICQ